MSESSDGPIEWSTGPLALRRVPRRWILRRFFGRL